MGKQTFWQEKTLQELTAEEWESLCDGCAKCCLHKIEDEDTEEIFFTKLACRLLDIPSCRCMRYGKRSLLVPECLDLRAGFTQFHWLPMTCAYRLLAEGKPLPKWHPLVSGRAETVREARMDVSNFAIPERPGLELSEHVIEGYA